MANEKHGYTYKNKRDGKIHARLTYTDETGKRRNIDRIVSNITEGNKLLKRLVREFENEGERAIEGDRMTFDELANIYRERKLIPAKYVDGRKVAGLRSFEAPRGFLKTLVAHFGRKRIKSITHADIENFKIIRLETPRGRDGQSRKIASVNRELETMRAVTRFAARQGWITRTPFECGDSLISKASEVKRERVLTFDEESRLLNACMKRDKQGRARWLHLLPLLTIAIDTAMRRGELFKLEWRDVDFVERLIRVRATTTKTEVARTVGMTPRVYETLKSLYEVAPHDIYGLVFGITDTVKKSFASVCQMAFVAEFRFHDCRHTAITRMIAAGMPATEVMKISGHTQMTTFARYVNTNEQAARRGAELLAAFHAGHLASIKTTKEETSKLIN